MADKPPLDDDDDLELELEPVDPEILAHERQRSAQKTDEAVSRIDVDELFRASDHSDLSVGWESWKQFRFGTRHLLVLTALLAIVLTLKQLLGGCSTIFVVCVLALGAGWFYVLQVERRIEADRQRRKREFVAALGRPAEPPMVAGVDPAQAEGRPRLDFKFAFSLQEVFITMTVVAVMLALIRMFGPHNMAVALGLIALVGLVVQAAGLEPPRVVVLGWWMLLVLYLAVGLVAALTGEEEAAMKEASPANSLSAGLA
jgi:hypothetical protein